VSASTQLPDVATSEPDPALYIQAKGTSEPPSREASTRLISKMGKQTTRGGSERTECKVELESWLIARRL